MLFGLWLCLCIVFGVWGFVWSYGIPGSSYSLYISFTSRYIAELEFYDFVQGLSSWFHCFLFKLVLLLEGT